MFYPALMNDDFFRFPEKMFPPINRYDMRSDITLDDGKATITVDMPGFKKEDIDISVDGQYVIIKAERKSETDEKDDNGQIVRRERFAGKVQRRYAVGDISQDNVSASLENGVLKIVCEFKDKETKKIEIK